MGGDDSSRHDDDTAGDEPGVDDENLLREGSLNRADDPPGQSPAADDES